LKYAETIPKDRMFILGGGEIFKQVLEKDLADEMIISHLDFEAEGEVHFPKFDESKWEITDRDRRAQFEIVYYKKK
jgi:Dihydrofolate reductase